MFLTGTWMKSPFDVSIIPIIQSWVVSNSTQVTTLLFKVGVLEEREEQLVGEVGKHLDFIERIFSDTGQNPSDLFKAQPFCCVRFVPTDKII